MTDAPKRPRAYDVKDGKVILSADRIEIDPSRVRHQRVGDITEDRLRVIIREEIAATAPKEVALQVRASAPGLLSAMSDVAVARVLGRLQLPRRR